MKNPRPNLLPTQEAILTLAAKAQCSPATARKALMFGVDKIRGAFLQARLRKEMGGANT